MKKLIILLIVSFVSLYSVFADPELSILGIKLGMTLDEVKEMADITTDDEFDGTYILDTKSFVSGNSNYRFDPYIDHDFYVDFLKDIIDNFSPIRIGVDSDDRINLLFATYAGPSGVSIVPGMLHGYVFAMTSIFGTPEITATEEGKINFTWKDGKSTLRFSYYQNFEYEVTIVTITLL